MKTKQAIGMFYSDYKDEEFDEQFKASLNSFIVRDSRIVFEFSGHDSIEGAYTGSCSLSVSGQLCKGTGHFLFQAKDRVGATVTATLTKDRTHYYLRGEWLDQGDTHASTFDVEARIG